MNLTSPLNSFSDPPEPPPRHTHPHRHDPSPIQFFHDPNIHVYPPLSMTPKLMSTLLSCQLLYSVHIRVMIRVFQEKSSYKNIQMYFNVHNIIMLWSTCPEIENTSSFRRNWTSSSSSSSSHNDTTITPADALKSLGGDDQWKRCWRNHDEDEIKVDFILENSKCNTSYKHLHWSMASSNRARCSQTPRLYPLANCLRRSNRIFPSIYRLHVLNQPVETSTAKP